MSPPDITKQRTTAGDARRCWKMFEKLLGRVVKCYQVVIFPASIRPSQIVSDHAATHSHPQPPNHAAAHSHLLPPNHRQTTHQSKTYWSGGRPSPPLSKPQARSCTAAVDGSIKPVAVDHACKSYLDPRPALLPRDWSWSLPELDPRPRQYTTLWSGFWIGTVCATCSQAHAKFPEAHIHHLVWSKILLVWTSVKWSDSVLYCCKSDLKVFMTSDWK